MIAKKIRHYIRKTPLLKKLISEPFVPYLIPMIGTPPYRFEGLNNFSLYLEADEEMLSAERSLVDKYLNHPLGSTGKNSIYRAAKINPLLTFSEVTRSFSIPDGGQQSIAYQEVSIIIPVVVEDLKVAGYFLPILFVDGPSAGNDQLQGSVPIVIGREMYGLPKIPATIEFDFNGQHINSGSVSFYGEEVITLTGKSAHAEEDRARYTDNQRLDFAERIFGKIKPNSDYTHGETTGGHKVDLTHVGHGNPLIGLRQLRDVANLGVADHQDVVESPYVVDPPTIPHPLGNALTVEFNLSSGLFDDLHLQEKYELANPTDGAIYLDIAANFGDPGTTRVRHIT